MGTSFSQQLTDSEGRYLTGFEHERLLLASLEWNRRLEISRMLEEKEELIVDYATQEFCDIMEDFEGPPGSLRRKKGHQDGRIMLRYLAQSVREGSALPIQEKVLSWLIGHLDNNNVTGRHMEVFLHFLLQGAHRELPAWSHRAVEEVFEQAIHYVRNATYSGTIHRAHRRIAQYAVDRIMSIMPDAAKKYGVSSVPKCKRDFELLTKEIARMLHGQTTDEIVQEAVAWLMERLVGNVEYPREVWFWSFLALKEGIVERCGPEATEGIGHIFDQLADRAEHIMRGVAMMNKAGDIADSAADRLMKSGASLGLYRPDEFTTAVARVNREIIETLAVLQASGDLDQNAGRLAQLWCESVIANMPSRETGLLAANLKALLESINEGLDEELAETLRRCVRALVEVAKRTEAACELSKWAQQITDDAYRHSAESLNEFTGHPAESHRILRAFTAKIISLLPAGPSGANGHELRQWILRSVLAFNEAPVEGLRRGFLELSNSFERTAPQYYEMVIGYFNDSIDCLERYQRLRGISQHAFRMTESAVQRGYTHAPSHPTLQKHGIEAGRRDGAYLLRKTADAAIVGGPHAEQDLHEYFQNEQVRFSNLPGAVIVEFVRGLHEQMREFPEVAKLLLELAQAAPAYAASYKIHRASPSLGEKVSAATIQQTPGYREQIGEQGLEACTRDNSIMLRGLAGFLLSSADDSEPLRHWWLERIGKNIRNKPINSNPQTKCATFNMEHVIHYLGDVLDHEELAHVSNYLKQLVHNPRGNESNNSTRKMTRPESEPAKSSHERPSMTFADI